VSAPFNTALGFLAALTGLGSSALAGADEVEGTFEFGSYGRINAASDLDGGAGDQVNVVGHGPRLQEGSYLELDFGYAVTVAEGPTFRTLLTLAIADALFHYDGDFDGQLTLRNAYVDAAEFGVSGLSLWAGSRMYRGDDIYVLDFWPLDDLNTVGGGLRYAPADNTTVALHVGLNQLNDPYQFQLRQVPAPQFGVEEVIFQNRERVLASLRGEQQWSDFADDLDGKIVVYADFQTIGPGQYDDPNDVVIELPSDSGFTVGLQFGVWELGENGFANLFLRYSGGLAAYDELAVPYGLASDYTATDAELLRLGASFNVEVDALGVTGGGYLQRFTDADSLTYDRDDYTEMVFALRPVLFVTDHFHPAFEVSYQRHIPDGLSARTDTYLEPALWQFAVMPSLSLDRGVYSRPQLRLIYAVSFLNEGARDLFPAEDPRHQRDVQHFLGIGAEWWFNSSSYE
jgi:maltoporin